MLKTFKKYFSFTFNRYNWTYNAHQKGEYSKRELRKALKLIKVAIEKFLNNYHKNVC